MSQSCDCGMANPSLTLCPVFLLKVTPVIFILCIYKHLDTRSQLYSSVSLELMINLPQTPSGPEVPSLPSPHDSVCITFLIAVTKYLTETKQVRLVLAHGIRGYLCFFPIAMTVCVCV